jgi:hypothetical protein
VALAIFMSGIVTKFVESATIPPRNLREINHIGRFIGRIGNDMERAMEKMLERAVLFAYRRVIALGADGIEAFETALSVLFDARPDMDDAEARVAISGMLAADPDFHGPYFHGPHSRAGASYHRS